MPGAGHTCAVTGHRVADAVVVAAGSSRRMGGAGQAGRAHRRATGAALGRRVAGGRAGGRRPHRRDLSRARGGAARGRLVAPARGPRRHRRPAPPGFGGRGRASCEGRHRARARRRSAIRLAGAHPARRRGRPAARRGHPGPARRRCPQACPMDGRISGAAASVRPLPCPDAAGRPTRPAAGRLRGPRGRARRVPRRGRAAGPRRASRSISWRARPTNIKVTLPEDLALARRLAGAGCRPARWPWARTAIPSVQVTACASGACSSRARRSCTATPTVTSSSTRSATACWRPPGRATWAASSPPASRRSRGVDSRALVAEVMGRLDPGRSRRRQRGRHHHGCATTPGRPTPRRHGGHHRRR